MILKAIKIKSSKKHFLKRLSLTNELKCLMNFLMGKVSLKLLLEGDHAVVVLHALGGAVHDLAVVALGVDPGAAVAGTPHVPVGVDVHRGADALVALDAAVDAAVGLVVAGHGVAAVAGSHGAAEGGGGGGVEADGAQQQGDGHGVHGGDGDLQRGH